MKRDWWSPGSSKEYDEKCKCYIDQYSKISVNGSYYSGNLTINENIADNSGLFCKSNFPPLFLIFFFSTVSWNAFKKFEAKYGSDNSTFVNGLSSDQLFFVSYAQSWCIAKDRISEWDPHSPSRARVLGAVMNSRAFSRSFNCTVGSRMNPETKCAIWEEPVPPSRLSLSIPQQTIFAQFSVIVLSILVFLYFPL